MTSRYRAGQRVAAIISELQDQGLSTSEIALELQQRGVLMRGAAVDPVADLCDNVRDIVADFAAAVGQPADEVTTLRARAEAAEQRAEAAEAALAQARADRALMTGLWLGAVAPRVLPAILPTDPGDRERLVAALDAVNLQPSAEACIAAGRAVIARIVLREAVPDIEAGEHVGAAGTAP